MPDFDKDLRPIIKPNVLETELPLNPFPLNVPTVPQFGVPEPMGLASGTKGLLGYYSNRTMQRGPYTDPARVTTADFLGSLKYGVYSRDIVDPEEYKNRTQTWPEQAANALVKTGGLALGTFFQTFNYLPKTATAAKDGSQLAGLGSFEEDIDKFYNNMEIWFPNYMSKYEREHPFRAAFGGKGFTNFWFDKMIKNGAFMVGTFGGILVQDALIGAATEGLGIAPFLASQLGRASWAISKIASTTTRADRAIAEAIALGKSAQQISRLESLYKVAEGGRLLNKARWGLNLWGASLTEAGIEAREGYNTIVNDLVEQYKHDNFGADPDEQTMQQIRSMAEDGMNTRLGVNIALLLASNAIQWDNMLRPWGSSKRGLMSTVDKEVYGRLSKIGLKEGSIDEFENIAAKSFKQRLLKGVAKAAPSIVSEGLFEEGLQFATQVGTEDYYNKKFQAQQNPETKAAWDSLSQVVNSTVKGLSEQFSSTEGQESMFLGAVLGAVGGEARRAFRNKEDKDLDRQRVEILNKFPLTGLMEDKLNNAANTIENKKGILAAVKNNNVFEFKNLKFKELFGFVESGITTGRYDLRLEQLKALKELTPDQFQNMFGIDFNEENKKLVSDYADALIEKAEEIKQTFKDVDAVFERNPFSNVKNPKTKAEQQEKERYYTYERWKRELAYQLSKGKDSKKRMSQIEQEISAIAPVSRDVLLKLGGEKTPSEEIIDTITKESKAAIPKEKEALIVKMVRDYNSLNVRDKIASTMYDNLSDPKGAFKYFEDALRDLFEEVKTATEPKEKFVVNTKDGEFAFEAGQEYVATSAKDRAKQDQLFGETGRFTFLGATDDGKISVALKESGQTINLTPGDLANLSFINSLDAYKSDNAKLFLNTSSKTFQFKPSKDGDPLVGYLEYDSFSNQLTFKTLDGKRSFTVTRDQFVKAEDGEAQVTLLEGEYTNEALEALSVPVTEAEILQKLQQKTQIIAEATKDTQKRLEEVNKELAIAKDNLDRTTKALQEATTTKEGKPRKKFTEAMRQAITTLNTAREKINKDVLSLEEEKEELENALSYLTQLAEYKDTLPNNYDDIFKELKEEMNGLKEIISHTDDGIKQGKALIDKASDAIASAFRSLREFLIKEREQNPDTPFFSEQLQEFAEQFMDARGIDGLNAKKDTLVSLMVDYEDFKKGLLPENIKSIPNMLSKLESLEKQVQELQEGLKNLQTTQAEKAAPLKAFEALAKSYDRRVKQEKRFRQDSQLISEVMSTLSSELHSLARTRKDTDPSVKKDEAIIPNATIVPSEEFSLATLAEHHLRSNFFGTNFYDIADLDRVGAIIVTASNEDVLGIPGLMARLVGDATLTEPEYLKRLEELNEKIRIAIDNGTIDQPAEHPFDDKTVGQIYEEERKGLEKKRAAKVDKDSIIALVFVRESADGKTRYFIDAYGNNIGEKATPDTAVYQVMPLEDLRWSNGNSMFRKTVRESTEKFIREKYGEWRKETLKNPPLRMYKVAPSAGIANYVAKLDESGKPIKGENLTVEDMYEMFSVEESGLVRVDKDVNQLATTNLIYVNTLNQNVSKGYSTTTAKLGSVFLNMPNKYVPLYGRRLTKDESITMYKVLKRFAELADQGKLKSPEGQRLTNWLRSIVYWGIPSKDAAVNSVWFQKAPKGGLNLYIGKDAITFPFTPEGIENNRDQIIATLQTVYNNIDAKRAANYNERYEEIVDMDENGQPVPRMVDGKPYWQNYQTWALSSKNRSKEEIPFKTLYSPPKGGQWATNVEGVYFVIEDNEFKYEQPVAPQMTIRPVAPKKPGEPKTDKKAEEKAGKEKPPTPPSPPKPKDITQTGKIDWTGKAVNTFNLDGEYIIQFKYIPATQEADYDYEIVSKKSDYLNAINYLARKTFNLKPYETPTSEQKAEAINNIETTLYAYIEAVIQREQSKKAGAAPAQPTAATFTPTTSYGTPTGAEVTTAVSDIKAKKADIEERRKDSLHIVTQADLDRGEDVGILEEDGVFTGDYYNSNNVLVESYKGTLKEVQDKINAKYDTELARELYKEMIAGKRTIDMTPAEQLVADKYITEELRKSVDAELEAAQPTLTPAKSGIEKLSNGNLRITAYRNEKSEPTSKGQYQRGKGLYLSLFKPYGKPEDNYLVTFEISPDNLLDRNLGFGKISEDEYIEKKKTRKDKNLDTLHEFKLSLGIKAEIGTINAGDNEVVIFDQTLINQALQKQTEVQEEPPFTVDPGPTPGVLPTAAPAVEQKTVNQEIESLIRERNDRLSKMPDKTAEDKKAKTQLENDYAEKIYNFYVDNASIEELVPIKTDIKIQDTTGSEQVRAYNERAASAFEKWFLDNVGEYGLYSWLKSGAALKQSDLVGYNRIIAADKTQDSQIIDFGAQIERRFRNRELTNRDLSYDNYFDHVAYVWAKKRKAGQTTQSLQEFFKNPQITAGQQQVKPASTIKMEPESPITGVLPTAGSSTATNEQRSQLEDRLNNEDFDSDEVLREKVKHETSAFKGENWEKVASWLGENFGNIAVYRVQNILRSIDGRREAWGMLKDGAIFVYEGAEEGTVYHEVFEAVWKALLTPQERAALANEFRSRKGSFTDRVTLENVKYSEATDDQLKEEIAEEFRRYVLEKEAPPKPAKGTSLIAKVFKELVEIIKTFFLGDKGLTNSERLFKKINEGKYKNFVPFADQLAFAKQGFLSVEEAYITQGAQLRVPGLSESQVHDIMQSMTYSTIKKLIKEDRGIFQIEALNKGENYIAARADVENYILASVKEAKRQYEGASYKTEAEREAAALEYEAYKTNKFNLIATINNNWSALEKRHEEVLKSYNIEFDEEDNIVANDEEISKMGDFVNPMLVDNYRKMGTAVRLFLSTIPVVNQDGRMVRSSINGPTLLPTSQAYMAIMNKTHTSVNPEDMLERIRQMALKDIVYKSVYERLTKADYKAENGIIWDRLGVNNLKLITSFYVVFSKQQPDIKNLYLLAEGAIQVGTANFSNLISQFIEEMETGINMAVRREGSFFEYKPQIKGFVLKQGALQGVALKTLEDRVRFLEDLNIVFSLNELKSLQANSPLLTKFIEATDGVFKSVKDSDRIVSINKKVFKIATRLRQLSEVKAVLKNPEFSSTFFGIEGQRKQAFIGHNAISKMHTFFLKAKNVKDLANTPYRYIYTKDGAGDVMSKNSVYLNRVFESATGEKLSGAENMLKFSIAEGTDNSINGKKKDSASLNYRERLIQEINMNLEGYHYILVPGDASIEAMWYTGQSVTYDNMTTGLDIVYEIFGGYLESEIELARQKRRIVAPEGSNRKTTDLRFFKGILSEKLHNDIVNVAIEEEEKSPEDIYKQFKTQVNAAVKNFLETKVDRTFNLLRTYNLIEPAVSEVMISERAKIADKDRTWESSYINFNGGRTMSFDTLLMHILTREVNFVINNIEAHKLVFGDPYQYSDELKRIKNPLSPKKNIVSESPNFNTALDRVWNEGYEKQEGEEEEDLGRTDFTKDYFETITVKNVIGFSELAGYDTFDKTDGAGIIMLKAHRVMRIREGNWNEDEERQFRYDIAWEKRDKNKKLTDEEKKLLKRNPNVPSTYTPSKPLVYGSAIMNNNNNNVVLDKFALYPISYRVQKEFDMHRKGESNMLKFYNKMQKEGKDYAVFESGRKVGADEAFELYKEGKFNEEEFTENQGVIIPFSAFYIQADVPSKDADETGRATQATKLVSLDLLEGGIPVDYKSDVQDYGARYEAWIKEKDKEAVSPLYKELKNNQKLLREIMLDGYNNLLRKLGIKELPNRRYEVKDNDYTKAAQAIRNQILRQEVNINISNTLDDLVQGSVVAEATPAYQQIRNILYSIVDSQVIRPGITGGMKVQLPVVLMETLGITEKEINGKTAYVSNELKMYEKDGERVMQVYIARWFDTDMTDDELLNYLNKTEEGKRILRGIAFRIPTQRQNSIDRIEVAGFLPKEYKDSIIVPEALVKKAGSDFDIDKLTLYLKSVYINEDNKPVEIPFLGYGEPALEAFKKKFEAGEFNKKAFSMFNSENKRELDRVLEEEKVELMDTPEGKLLFRILGEGFEKDITKEFILNNTPSSIKEAIVRKMYTKSLQNAYVQSMENLVASKENYDALIKPNSSADLAALGLEVYEATGNTRVDYTSVANMLDSSFMSKLRHFFVAGKYAIGIAAVNQTNQSLMQRILSYIDVDKIRQQPYTERIWLGDGNISLRHNSVNYNGKVRPTFSMIKNQDGEVITETISQFIDGYVDISKGPWIMELGAFPNVASTYLFLVKVGVPIRTVAYFMNQPIIRDYLKNIENSGYSWLFIDDIVLDTVNNTKYATEKPYETVQAWLNNIREKNNKTPLVLSDEKPERGKSEIEESVGKSSFSAEEKLKQQFALAEFLKYAKMAGQLFNFTQGSNFDTANFNDPYLVFKKQMQRQKAQAGIISSVEEVLKESFIGDLADTIVNSRDALAQILISDKIKVRTMAQKILSRYVDLSDREFVKVARKLNNDIFDWAVQTSDLTHLNLALKELLTSDEAVALEMQDFMTEVQADPTHPLHYNDIVKEGGFLRILPSPKPGGIINLKGVNKDNKVYDQNQIIHSFRELRDYLGGSSNLYKNLVNTAILQSGVTNSPISFTSLLPYEDFKEIYNAVIKDLELMDLEDFYKTDSFEKNNWANQDIIPYSSAKTIFIESFGFIEPVYNPGMAFLSADIKQAIKDQKIPQLMSVSALSEQGRSEFFVHSWEDKTYTRAEIAKMREEGDFSYMNKGLFKRVYREDGTPYTYLQSSGREYAVYKMVNAWGDSYRAKEFYNIDRPSIFDNGFLESFSIDDKIVLTYFGVAQNKALPGMRPMPLGKENIARLEAGLKTTTIRAPKEAQNIGINVLESAEKIIGDKVYVVTHRGFITVEEAGGAEAMVKSEGLPTEPTNENRYSVTVNGVKYYAKYNQTAMWLGGTGRMHVYDIRPATNVKMIRDIPLSDLETMLNSPFDEKITEESSFDKVRNSAAFQYIRQQPGSDILTDEEIVEYLKLNCS